MVALDAQFELRTAHSARWVPSSRFTSPSALGDREILARIRVPLEPWDFTYYHKLRTAGINEAGGGILFLMRNVKNILTHIRVTYSGKTVFRDKNGETMLAGKHLPLDRKDAAAFLESWTNYLSVLENSEYELHPGYGVCQNPDLIKAQIINFINSAIMRISD